MPKIRKMLQLQQIQKRIYVGIVGRGFAGGKPVQPQIRTTAQAAA